MEQCGSAAKAQIMYHGCALTGSPAPPIVQQLNYMKNRSSSPKAKDIKPTITLEAVLAAGKDTNRWSDNSAAEIEGVVFDVKPGGIESTNCRAQGLADRDTHIEIVRSMEDSGLTRRGDRRGHAETASYGACPWTGLVNPSPSSIDPAIE
jgi:hypothetical protein